MKRLIFLGLLCGLGITFISHTTSSYQRSKRCSDGVCRSYRGWYVYRSAQRCSTCKPETSRVWWGEQWWGPGWSLYPHYWTYGRAAKLGLPFMAQEGQWNRIEDTINNEIKSLSDKRLAIEAERHMRYRAIIARLSDQIEQLHKYLADVKIYRDSKITHTEEERKMPF